MVTHVRLKQFWLMLLATLSTGILLGQDKKVEIDINAKSDDAGGFMSQPWVWIVGGAVFILLLVALLRGNRSKA